MNSQEIVINHRRRFQISRLFGYMLAASLFFLVGANGLDANATPRATDGFVYAEVVRVDPIIEVVRDPIHSEVCRDVRLTRKPASKTPLVLGAIIGGVIGNQFGSGRGRTAATVAGAALGASLGADHARKHGNTSDAERCEVAEDYRGYERVVGYRVTYRYDDVVGTTETQQHPGTYLKLPLSVVSS